MARTFADKALSYFLSLKEIKELPPGISIMNPYENNHVAEIVTIFFERFFNDTNKRIYILGINPGRFGGGTTGISFTDPQALQKYCGIGNNLDKKNELSSRFIYSVINSYGGAEKFYSRFFLSALFPMALIKNGKNYNYYDDPVTYLYLRKQIINSLEKQTSFGSSNKIAICLGRKNYKYFAEINCERNFFSKIDVLDHPRYIMQYKNKSAADYVKLYIEKLKEAQRFF